MGRKQINHEQTAARFPAGTLARIDRWAEKNAGGSRSEALRLLVEIGLAAAAPVRPRNREAEAAARMMAAAQVDALTDPALPEEERRRRKRRLIRKPKELRRRRSPGTKSKV